MLPFLPVLADVGGTLTLIDRTEIRGRSPGSTPGSVTSFDLETTPEARLAFPGPRSLVSFTLAPRFTAWDITLPGHPADGFHPVALGAGTVHLEWRTRTLRVSLDQAGSFGQLSFAAYGAAPGPDGTPPRVDVVPAARVIAYEAEKTTLGTRSVLGRWTIGTSLGYQLSGGATVDARAVLPYQSGPFGEARAEYAVSRSDHAETLVAASNATFSSGPEDLLVEVDETWRHAWTRTTETRLSAGASEARVRTTAAAPHTTELHPVAEAVLEDHQRLTYGRLDLRAGLRLGPLVNQVVGLVDERFQGTLAATHTQSRFSAHAYAAASQSVPGGTPNAIRIVSGEVGVAYAIVPEVTFDTGVRGLWQRQDLTQETFLQGTLFVGVTLRAAPERL